MMDGKKAEVLTTIFLEKPKKEKKIATRKSRILKDIRKSCC